MFQKKDCSYESYTKIMKLLKESGKYIDYKEALSAQEFIVLRHDIEFSVQRALDLANLEQIEGIESSYFVQLTNNSYNVFSEKNRMRLKEIRKLGHKIGLHYHRNEQKNMSIDELKMDIQYQAELLGNILEMEIDRFSFHRPLREHLEANLQIDGLINTYDRRLFVLTDEPNQKLDVKYIADSNHQWKYGIPTKECLEKNPKVQLLLHPLSWSETGADHVNNFQMLIDEHKKEFINTIKAEWKIFNQLEGKLR